MAQLASTNADRIATERRVLDKLMGLYQQESQIYNQVLELSRKQGQIISSQSSFSQVRRVLQEKKECLARISRLEELERPSRELWRDGRRNWSAVARAQMHKVLQEIGNTIEEILKCEEQNDQLLLEQMR